MTLDANVFYGPNLNGKGDESLNFPYLMVTNLKIISPSIFRVYAIIKNTKISSTHIHLNSLSPKTLKTNCQSQTIKPCISNLHTPLNILSPYTSKTYPGKSATNGRKATNLTNNNPQVE